MKTESIADDLIFIPAEPGLRLLIARWEQIYAADADWDEYNQPEPIGGEVRFTSTPIIGWEIQTKEFGRPKPVTPGMTTQRLGPFVFAVLDAEGRVYSLSDHDYASRAVWEALAAERLERERQFKAQRDEREAARAREKAEASAKVHAMLEQHPELREAAMEAGLLELPF